MNWQLYFGKLIVGIIFPLSASYAGIVFYLAIIGRQDLNLPPTAQIIQLLVLTLAHAVLMVAGAMVISTQATSVKAANLLASFIVVPVAFLIQGESVLLFWGDIDGVLWWAVLGVFVLAAILVRVGIAHFQREYLLGREIDALNLKWMWQTFWGNFWGPTTSLGAWYQVQVRSALRRFSASILIILFLAIASSAATYFWVTDIIPAYANEFSQEEIDAIFSGAGLADSLLAEDSGISVGFIFGHNVRATLAIFGLGVFTFGVLGVLVYIINIGVIGGLFAALNYLGFSAMKIFLAGIVPHGIFEIPAIMLVSAGVLYFGSVMITPNPKKTMGEVLLLTLADCFKVFVGLVLPLLLIAALIETYITPQLLVGVL